MIRYFRYRVGRTTSALGVIAMLSACALSGPTRPVPDANYSANLPPVAAEYLSILEVTDTEHPQGEPLQSHWRFWRDETLVIRGNLDTHTSDVWRYDGKTLSQKKLFHDDKRGLEFQPGDLSMLGIEPQWQKLTPLFDTALLNKLPKVDSGWRDDVPFQRYEGRVDNVDWTIEVRTDLMLPILIDYQSPKRHETITLVSAYPIAQAPWVSNSGEDYNFIDYSDLGDMQSDPFAKKVEIMLGGAHPH